MTWRDRRREAAYTPPSGTRLLFGYPDLSKAREKLTKAYTTPGANTTLVQDQGVGGRRFPVDMIFSGPDHDLQSRIMEAALVESGVGVLEHPAYGKFNVVPFGKITQIDRDKTAANQSIIQVVFYESVKTIYPSRVPDLAALTLLNIDEFFRISRGLVHGFSLWSSYQLIVLSRQFSVLSY